MWKRKHGNANFWRKTDRRRKKKTAWGSWGDKIEGREVRIRNLVKAGRGNHKNVNWIRKRTQW